MKNILFWSATIIILIAWPLSLLSNLPKLNKESVLQISDNSGQQLLVQKLALDKTQIKRIFYNRLTTIPLTGYIKNILVLSTPGYYFFNNFPQTDPNDFALRLRFPYPTVIAFLTGIYISLKNKKSLFFMAAGILFILLLSFFKYPDGWDLLLYPVIAKIIFEGFKEISVRKLGWLALLLIAVISLTEIAKLYI